MSNNVKIVKAVKKIDITVEKDKLLRRFNDLKLQRINKEKQMKYLKNQLDQLARQCAEMEKITLMCQSGEDKGIVSTYNRSVSTLKQMSPDKSMLTTREEENPTLGAKRKIKQTIRWLCGDIISTNSEECEEDILRHKQMLNEKVAAAKVRLYTERMNNKIYTCMEKRLLIEKHFFKSKIEEDVPILEWIDKNKKNIDKMYTKMRDSRVSVQKEISNGSKEIQRKHNEFQETSTKKREDIEKLQKEILKLTFESEKNKKIIAEKKEMIRSIIRHGSTTKIDPSLQKLAEINVDEFEQFLDGIILIQEWFTKGYNYESRNSPIHFRSKPQFKTFFEGYPKHGKERYKDITDKLHYIHITPEAIIKLYEEKTGNVKCLKRKMDYFDSIYRIRTDYLDSLRHKLTKLSEIAKLRAIEEAKEIPHNIRSKADWSNLILQVKQDKMKAMVSSEEKINLEISQFIKSTFAHAKAISNSEVQLERLVDEKLKNSIIVAFLERGGISSKEVTMCVANAKSAFLTIFPEQGEEGLIWRQAVEGFILLFGYSQVEIHGYLNLVASKYGRGKKGALMAIENMEILTYKGKERRANEMFSVLRLVCDLILQFERFRVAYCTDEKIIKKAILPPVIIKNIKSLKYRQDQEEKKLLEEEQEANHLFFQNRKHQRSISLKKNSEHSLSKKVLSGNMRSYINIEPSAIGEINRFMGKLHVASKDDEAFMKSVRVSYREFNQTLDYSLLKKKTDRRHKSNPNIRIKNSKASLHQRESPEPIIKQSRESHYQTRTSTASSKLKTITHTLHGGFIKKL